MQDIQCGVARQARSADSRLERGIRSDRHRKRGGQLEVQVLAAQGLLGRQQVQTETPLPAVRVPDH